MAKKGDIIRVGGKKMILTDNKGSARRVTARDEARIRIKRDTKSGKAPPIPQVRGGPRTQKELNKARAKAAARKAKRPDAIKNEPTGRGIRRAFDEAAEGRRKAEQAQQRKK